MFRLLFWIALIGLLIWYWKRFKNRAHKAPVRQEAEAPLSMVRCAQCQLHLPQQQAIKAGGHWYCCEAHRTQHQAR